MSRKVYNGCMFCKGIPDAAASHYRNQCPVFKGLKRTTNATPYISTDLDATEYVGFSAAGILPCRRLPGGEIEMLLAREFRPVSSDSNGGDMLNFLGGKRRTEKQLPLTCAIDKLLSETGECLFPETIKKMRCGCPIVCWSSHSRYVLYLFELSKDDFDIDVHCTGNRRNGVKRLEWVKRSSITNLQCAQTLMHSYALPTLTQLLDCNIMQHLESLFDVVRSHSQSSIGDNTEEVDTVVATDMNAHYDLQGLLRGVGISARPSLQPISDSPSFKELQLFVNEIPKSDIDKLRRKMHPDWLPRILKRCPREEEIKLAITATQVLDMLTVATHNNEKDIMENLLTLETLRKKYHAVTDVTDDLNIVIKSLKLSKEDR